MAEVSLFLKGILHWYLYDFFLGPHWGDSTMWTILWVFMAIGITSSFMGWVLNLSKRGE